MQWEMLMGLDHTFLAHKHPPSAVFASKPPNSALLRINCRMATTGADVRISDPVETVEPNNFVQI